MIVAGFGFRSGASPSSLADALALACRRVGAIDALAAPADKLGLLEPMARERGLTIIPVAPDALAAACTFTQSPVSLAVRGTGSVAEASALAAAGSGACLLVSRCISSDRMATCAIAQGAQT